MGCPYPEHHRGNSNGGGLGDGVIIVAAGIVAGIILVTWIIHLLIMIATVIGGAVMIGGAAWGYLRYRAWRAQLGAQRGPYPPALGDQAGGVHLHIYGDVPPEIVSQLTQRRELGGQAGTVPAPRALRPARRSPRARR